MPDTSIHFRTCHLCEAMCGLEMTVSEGQICSIKGDKQDPFSLGHICPKASAIADIHQDPNRLRGPVKRVGEDWVEISWDEAIELVASSLEQVRAKHGDSGFGVYLGNPSVHNYGILTHGPQLLKALKTPNRFSASSVDQWPHQMAAWAMYGHQFMVAVPDLDRTQYFLMLGANPLASNGSLMTAPGMKRRLKEIQERGGKVVVIDPRRTETAAVADQHFFIRPGSDAAFLVGILKTLMEEDLVKPGGLTPYLKYLDLALGRLNGVSVDQAAQACGIGSADIRQIARSMAEAEGAVCYGRMGVSTQPFGALCQWLIQLVNIATGNLDRPGGMMFSLPAFDMVGAPNTRPGHHNVWRSRVRGYPEFAGELPAAAMAEEMLTSGDGQIRAFMTIAGNPVLSTPNGPQLEKALSGLDFMVSLDFYINETTRFAHVILPPASPLEHDHYDLIFHVFAIRNTAKYCKPIFSKPEGARHDWEILTQLAERLGGKPLPMTPGQVVDYALRNGPYGQSEGLSVNKLDQHPHGLDLGPLKPCLPERLFTKDKKIDCAPDLFLKDLDRMEAELFTDPPKSQLVLIGRRHLRSNNSWMHNYRRLVKGPNRCVLLMNPADMASRGLKTGQNVVIRSRCGELTVPVDSTEDMMPGVVSLPHGWGHNRKGARLDVAREHAGVSVNDLTDPLRLDEVSGNAAVNGVPVEVKALVG